MQTTALIFALAATASQGMQPKTMARPLGGDTVPAIEVQNNRTVPVTVILERGDFDVRVGTVGPLQTVALPVAPWLLRDGSVQFFVDPKGERDLASSPIDVPHGKRIALFVPRSGTGFIVRPQADRMSAELPPADDGATTLTVENERSSPVVVYADEDPFDTRLGTIPALTTTTLKVPSWMVLTDGDLSIVVHPTRGRDLGSQDLVIRPHEHLGLRVPAE